MEDKELRDFLITWEHGPVPKEAGFKQWDCDCFPHEKISALKQLIASYTQQAEIKLLEKIKDNTGEWEENTHVGIQMVVDEWINEILKDKAPIGDSDG